MSAMARPKGTGPWSSSPLSHITPERACASRSWPGRCTHGPSLAVAGDRGIDDAGVDRPDRLVVEAEPLDDAGAEVLHAPRRPWRAASRSAARSAGFLRSSARLSLQRLMAWKMVESPPISVSREVEPARQVAAVGPLDLDHPGAEVLQPQRRVGPGEELAQVDDDDAVEEGQGLPFRHRSSSRSCRRNRPGFCTSRSAGARSRAPVRPRP